jgi:hypothetical protein
MKMYRPHRLCPRNSKPKEPSLYRSLCISILSMFLSTVMLVGTTFAWFDSSATSAVSTITAASQFNTTQAISQDTIRLAVNSASAVAFYDSDNASETDISLDDLPWSPFTSNSGSPFSSVPFSPGDSQVIFLRLDNTGSSDSTYRLALNLLSEAPGKTADGQEVSVSGNLVYGYEVLNTTDLFELAVFNPADRADSDTEATNFVTDSLSEHRGERNGDIITYGGNICSVTLSAGTVKYVAIALYMPENVELPEFVALPTIAVQLAMTVEQASTTEPQQPNVVISPISNSTVVEIKQAIIGQPSENEVSKDSAEEAKKEPVDGTKTGEETSDNGTTDQPAPGGTETPASPETPPSSTGETGTPSGASDTGTTSDTDTSGGTETHVSEPQNKVPTT